MKEFNENDYPGLQKVLAEQVKETEDATMQAQELTVSFAKSLLRYVQLTTGTELDSIKQRIEAEMYKEFLAIMLSNLTLAKKTIGVKRARVILEEQAKLFPELNYGPVREKLKI